MRFSKIFLTSAALLMLTASTIPTEAARKQTKRTKSPAGIAVRAGEKKTLSDDLTVQKFSYKKGNSKIIVDYPIEGKQPLTDSLRCRTKEYLNSDFSGSLATPQALIKSAGKAIEPEESLEEEVNISFITPDLVTITLTGYDYFQGAAHGMPLNVNTTYLIENPRRLTKEMLPSAEIMRPLIINGLMDYFDVTSEEELRSCLMLEDGLQSLHVGEPFIAEGGLHIIYTPYEIAPYVAGMPEAIIPLSEMRKIATEASAPFFR